MGVQRIKRAASLMQWRERILACRSSGLPAREWCSRQKINVKTYYRWERLCMAEAENYLAPADTVTGGQLVRVEPKLLPSVSEEAICELPPQLPSLEQTAAPVRIQHSQTFIELSATANIRTIAELVKALNQP